MKKQCSMCKRFFYREDFIRTNQLGRSRELKSCALCREAGRTRQRKNAAKPGVTPIENPEQYLPGPESEEIDDGYYLYTESQMRDIFLAIQENKGEWLAEFLSTLKPMRDRATGKLWSKQWMEAQYDVPPRR